MAVEIRQTVVSPDAKGSLVQLHISDAPLLDEGAASFRLVLSATVRLAQTPMLAEAQLAVLKKAREEIGTLIQAAAAEVAKIEVIRPS